MQNLEHATDLIVFSSHHFGASEVRTTDLMVRFSHRRRIYFFNSPIMELENITPYYTKVKDHDVIVIQPHLSKALSVFDQHDQLLELLKELIIRENITRYTTWTDTPSAISYIRHLNAEIIVYDCLEDHTYSPLADLEKELYEYADAALTSGQSAHMKTATILPYAFSAYTGTLGHV